MKKKKVYKYALSVDFEGGDGADLFALDGRKASMHHLRENLPHLLLASDPPPKVEVVALTKAQWQKACRAGREQA